MGLPLIVNTPPLYEPVTPDGNPVTVAPVLPKPPTVYVIFVSGDRAQSTCASVPAAELSPMVAFSLTVIVPDAVGLIHEEPEVPTE